MQVRTVSALAVDAAVVVVFAVIGRVSHGEDLSPGGIATTAWPFLVAVVAGSLLGRRLGGEQWWRQALVVWAVTAAGGMLLRVASGTSAAPGFIVVGSVFLALFLFGWRFVASRRRP
jgi:Na+/melibiose symporter-like transporter